MRAAMRGHRGGAVGSALTKLREIRIMAFKWDEYKAALNVQKHGVSFDIATLCFMIQAELRTLTMLLHMARNG
jgi:hypothetical protein